MKDEATGPPLKITVVGDSGVGKTCLLITRLDKQFLQDPVPAVLEVDGACSVVVDGQLFQVALQDTAGTDDYTSLRPQSYPNTNCFLICFSISSRASFENVTWKWYPEVRHHCPHVPIVLVGTKKDVRSSGGGSGNSRDEEKNAEEVSEAEARELQRHVQAASLVECSARSGHGLEQVFVAAVRAATGRPCKPGKRTACVAL